MQIAAQYSAAITILEDVLNGAPAERALLSWSRNSRFAGSKDRAAIRDIVFDCLRKKQSYGAQFSSTPRGLILARAYEAGDISLFDGQGFSPAAPSEDEMLNIQAGVVYNNIAQELDFPEFLIEELTAQYGDDLRPIMNGMRDRAPVDLRVNILKTHKEEAVALLARDHIFVDELDICQTALRIKLNPRKLAQSRAFNYGYVELQDVSSQIVAQMAEAKPDMDVLDYCAGGGGKTLALGMDMAGRGRIDAWDISAARMKEIPERASRSGLNVNVLKKHPSAQYDLVFVDAPCSGSGAWRRSPDAKWRLNKERLNELCELQLEVLSKAAKHVKKDGRLLYATCSLLQCENRAIVDQFLQKTAGYKFENDRHFSPLTAGDGFYGAVLTRLP